jgi:excisionase family DNA binding protein
MVASATHVPAHAREEIVSPFLSVKQTALYMNISRSTVYRLIDLGDLDRRKVGHKTLITRQSIDAFLDSSRRAKKHVSS